MTTPMSTCTAQAVMTGRPVALGASSRRDLALDLGNEDYRYELHLCAEMRNDAYVELEVLDCCGPQT